MADLADVENALVGAALAALYPGGAAAGSILGSPIRVYRGWPLSGPLGLDLAAGICNVSVFSVPNATANTTRWPPVVAVTPGSSTLSLMVAGNAVTVAGTAAAGQLAGILADNQPFVYKVSSGDTPALICASLATMIRAQRTCWLAGTTVSIPGVAQLIARTVAAGTMLTEWARQRQEFRLSLWCPAPSARDAVASCLGAAFAQTAFLTLADRTSGRLRYRSTAAFDDDQNGQLYRRDMLYDVEYGTTSTVSAQSMLFGDLMIAGASNYG